MKKGILILSLAIISLIGCKKNEVLDEDTAPQQDTTVVVIDDTTTVVIITDPIEDDSCRYCANIWVTIKADGSTNDTAWSVWTTYCDPDMMWLIDTVLIDVTYGDTVLNKYICE